MKPEKDEGVPDATHAAANGLGSEQSASFHLPAGTNSIFRESGAKTGGPFIGHLKIGPVEVHSPPAKRSHVDAFSANNAFSQQLERSQACR
jgi:hypothetical protein